ncbi:MAG TPA: hypothetical protein VKY74_01375 [Chloroflexia bacterium]|nr:hypothetical protein [Chloroflexia bacterium]
MHPSLVDAAIQRTRRYWFIDGLVELGMGLYSVTLGILWFVRGWVGPDSALGLGLLLLSALFGLLYALLSRPLIGWLRERLTYPRTGYAPPPRPSHRDLVIGGLVGAGVGILLVCATLGAVILAIANLFQPHGEESLRTTLGLLKILVPGGIGLLVGGILAYIAAYYKLLRFYLLAGFSWLVGGVLSGLVASYGGVTGVEWNDAWRTSGLAFLFIGGALILSGAVTLRTYLRDNPLPVEEPA